MATARANASVRTSRPSPNGPKRLARFSILRFLALTILYGVFAGAGLIYYVVGEYSRDLPDDLTTALDYRPERATQVFSADGELIGEFFLKKRIVVPPERIPDHVENAFVAAEDGRFWQHPGFDLIGIARAAYTNYTSGGTRQGASTITQQVTRMLLLSDERTYHRKIRELILSVRVERELRKEEILHIYVNHVYLGHGAYGVQAGAEIYFAKQVEQLTVAEAAILAGLVQAPSRYALDRNMDAARERQEYVLGRMRDDGYITPDEYRESLAEPLVLVDSQQPLNLAAAPYFVELIRRWATRRFGHRSVFYGGLRIYTTLDVKAQERAEAAVRRGLVTLDRRIGFRGPLGHLEGDTLAEFRNGPQRPYVAGTAAVGAVDVPAPGSRAPTPIEDTAELVKSGGRSLRPGVPYIGAVVGLPGSGGVIVDLGPEQRSVTPRDARLLRDWKQVDEDERSGPPRGRRRWRPPVRLRVGDLIPVALPQVADADTPVALAQTPEVQSALVAMDPHTGRVVAMVGGYDYNRSQFNRATQAHRQIGSAIKPFIYATAMDDGVTHLDILSDSRVSVATAAGWWTPKNYDDRYRGPVTLRTALAKSLNTVSVRLILRVGVDRLIQTLRAVGITSKIPRHVSIALGTPDFSLMEVAAAYSALANGGLRTEPRLVDLVADDNGRIIEDYREQRPSQRAISPQLAYLTTNLMEAVAKRGTARRAQVLGRAVAGKTGTSTEHRDAWFMGFTPDLLCGVWVGRDDFTPIGSKATGGGAALPIWLAFMESAHPDTPVRPFPVPDDVVFVRADELSGSPAGPGARNAVWVPFIRGTVPRRFAPGVVAMPFGQSSAFPPGAP